MSTTSIHYKNTVKKLRKANANLTYENIKSTRENFYKYLSELEHEDKYEKMEDEKICREKNVIKFNDLPEDAIYVILGFLSCNTRLAILKHKYHKNFIKNIIVKVPKTNNGLTKIWKCAKIASKFLHGFFDYPCAILNNISTLPVDLYKHDIQRKNYNDWYKQAFTKIILTAIKHYTKIYKNKTKKGLANNKKVIEHTEKIILKIFAHLAIS
jgi:hypothetical protein